MVCYKCGKEIGKDDKCPSCGADVQIFQKINKISNCYYNEGLERAKVRDMSGAINYLKQSLKFNKENIEARNLLGLVYYEIGEVVNAIDEWVISKNYVEQDNLATKYIDDIQNGHGRLESINNTIKKYNQALQYCKQGSTDLATIQLKKAVSINPKMLRARQLLALVYIQDGKPELAKKQLVEAKKLDANNIVTLKYLKEVKGILKDKPTNAKIKNKQSADTVSYQKGNDTIIRPRKFRDFTAGSAILYMVIGILIGAAVVAVLLIPNVKKNANSSAINKLKTANETISTKEGEITSLKDKVKKLNDKLKTDGTAADQLANTKSTYEALINAYVLYTSKDYVGAGDQLAAIDTKYLSEGAVNTYNTINAQISESYMSTLFARGTTAYKKGDMQAAISDLQKVVNKDQGYKNGDAAFYLAQAFNKAGDVPSAQKYYQYIIDTYPATKKATTAKNFMMTHPVAQDQQQAADPNAQSQDQQQAADPNAQPQDQQQPADPNAQAQQPAAQ